MLTCVRQQPHMLILEGVQPHVLCLRKDYLPVVVVHQVL